MPTSLRNIFRLVAPALVALASSPLLGAQHCAPKEAVRRDANSSIAGDANQIDDPILCIESLKKSPRPAAEILPQLMHFLDHPTLCVRCSAATAIADCGAKANSAEPKLRSIIQDPSTPAWLTEDAVLALGKVGAGADDVKCISAQLENPKASTKLKLRAIEALGNFGPDAGAALPVLTSTLNDFRAEVRWNAFCSIRRIHSTRCSAANIDSAPDIHALSLEESVELLNGLAGSRADSALKLLLQIAADSSLTFCRTASIEIMGQWLNHADAVRALLIASGDRDDIHAAVARKVLSKLGPEFPAAVTVLVEGLGSENPAERRTAAALLKLYGPNAAPAMPAFVKAFEHTGRDSDYSELGLYLDAVRSMGIAGGGAADSIAALLPERLPLYEKRGKMAVLHLRAFILVTLAETKVPEKAVPFIVDYLANFDPSMVRSYVAAIRAAGALGSRAAPLVPYIVKAFEHDFLDEAVSFEKPFVSFSPVDPGTTARVEAIRALARIGPGAKDAVPALRELVRQGQHEALTPDIDLGEEAQKALRRIVSNE